MTDALDLTPAAVLNRAADVIEQRGWIQEWFVDPVPLCDDGRVCALGAIAVAAGYKPNAWTDLPDADLSPLFSAADQLINFLALADGPYRHGPIQVVGGWNDDQQTITEVTAALRAAAQEVSGA